MFSKNIAITDTTDGLPNPRRIWAVIAASLALIMSVLDANIVNVVLPTLSREFGTSPSTTIWVMNAYQLAITAVSYTHLDVYKRQSMPFMRLIRDVSVISATKPDYGANIPIPIRVPWPMDSKKARSLPIKTTISSFSPVCS